MGADLFGFTKPRAAPRILMHIDDAGMFPDGRPCGHFCCRICGREEWLAASLTEMRRGIPCTTCNAKEPTA